jgi:5-methyltetrahydrofolate--homocysteine methyltransferase
MIVIGERINASNKSVGEAITNRDSEFIADLARRETEAGANFIDVNTGTGNYEYQQEKDAMKWLVATVQAATGKPLAIDSEHPEVIAAGIEEYKGGEMIINSVTAETDKLEAIGPLAAEYDARLVALAMGSEGVPETVEKRLEACDAIVNRLAQMGVKTDKLLFDPLVIPVSVDSGQGVVTLNTIREIKARYPEAKTVVGLSNISFGLPNRRLVNRSFLLMAAAVGLDAAIMDPLDARIMGIAKVADMLAGRDNLCRNYIRAHRRGAITD